MLVACYRNPLLAELINVEELSGLLERTIRFFDSIIQPQAVLSVNTHILRVAGQVAGIHDNPKLLNDAGSEHSE